MLVMSWHVSSASGQKGCALRVVESCNCSQTERETKKEKEKEQGKSKARQSGPVMLRL